MKKFEVSRRMMLRGAGGFVLPLPFLPSLVERPAYGQPAATARLPRFVAILTNHGGIRESSMYPDAAMLTQTGPLPGYTGKWGNLVRRTEGSEGVLSNILRGAQLTERIASKMNVVRGLDIPFYIAHNRGGQLGNYADNDGNGDEGRAVQGDRRATIDQVIAWSPSFYKTGEPIKVRSMNTGGSSRSYAWTWSSPTSRSGTIQAVSVETNTASLFMKIFLPQGTSTPMPVARKPIIDRVLENYKTLSQSNRRLSAADKQRLNDHVEQLTELQRKVGLSNPALPIGSCKDVKSVTQNADSLGGGRNPSAAKTKYALYNDVIAAAFMCGTSRVAVISVNEENFTTAQGGSWHQDYAHLWNSAGPQTALVEANRNVFQSVFLDLATKLDVAESGEFSYLDNTVMAWSQESAEETHDNRSMPLVMAGSAAGYFKTGIYADYRNPGKQLISYGSPRGNPGLTWNRWLGTALQAMGIPKSEWQKSGEAGYGVTYVADGFKSAYVSGVVESAGDPLPFIKA